MWNSNWIVDIQMCIMYIRLIQMYHIHIQVQITKRFWKILKFIVNFNFVIKLCAIKKEIVLNFKCDRHFDTLSSNPRQTKKLKAWSVSKSQFYLCGTFDVCYFIYIPHILIYLWTSMSSCYIDTHRIIQCTVKFRTVTNRFHFKKKTTTTTKRQATKQAPKHFSKCIKVCGQIVNNWEFFNVECHSTPHSNIRKCNQRRH